MIYNGNGGHSVRHYAWHDKLLLKYEKRYKNNVAQNFSKIKSQLRTIPPSEYLYEQEQYLSGTKSRTFKAEFDERKIRTSSLGQNILALIRKIS